MRCIETWWIRRWHNITKMIYETSAIVTEQKLFILLWKSCEATLNDMEAELEAVPFDEFAFIRDEFVKNKNENYSFEAHTKTFDAYVSRAKEGKRLLEEEKNQNEKYDRILKTFDEYKSKQDDLEKTRNKHQMITIHPGRRVFLSGWIEVIYEFFCK